MNRMSYACVAVILAGAVASAQRRVPPGSQAATVGVTIALKAGEAYQFTGQAKCTHAPRASIYGILAEQWNVEQHDGPRSAVLTLWKPKDGAAPMFSLHVSTGGRSHAANTVKAPGAPAQGSGSVTLAAAGAGGTFTVDAKAADGTPITGTIKCDAFTPAMAEGGD